MEKVEKSTPRELLQDLFKALIISSANALVVFIGTASILGLQETAFQQALRISSLLGGLTFARAMIQLEWIEIFSGDIVNIRGDSQSKILKPTMYDLFSKNFLSFVPTVRPSLKIATAIFFLFRPHK